MKIANDNVLGQAYQVITFKGVAMRTKLLFVTSLSVVSFAAQAELLTNQDLPMALAMEAAAEAAPSARRATIASPSPCWIVPVKPA